MICSVLAIKREEVYAMLIIRDFSNRFQQMSGMPINSKGGKDILRKAGIDTNSKQYPAVMQSMSSASHGVGYMTVSAIKNRMSRYDKDGDYVSPLTGMAGLVVTDKNRASKNKTISIPESSRDEMFELTKKEFLRENGVANGDTTKRTDVYMNLYRKMNKNDRLAAGHTLEQYGRAYTQAFVDAVKKINPKWEPGKPIPDGALDGITGESIDSALVKSGSELVKRSSVSGSSLDLQI